MATEKTALDYVNDFFDGFYDTAVKAPISLGDFLARISGYRDYQIDSSSVVPDLDSHVYQQQAINEMRVLYEAITHEESRSLIIDALVKDVQERPAYYLGGSGTMTAIGKTFSNVMTRTAYKAVITGTKVEQKIHELYGSVENFLNISDEEFNKFVNDNMSDLHNDPDLTYDPNKLTPNTPTDPTPLNPTNGHPVAPLPPLLLRRDPLVLDLNKDGLISTVSLADSTAFFDLTGDGIKEKVGWVQASEGIVAFDKNGNGKIDGISEVFGTATTSGFAELRALADSNYDGIIDRRDELYNQLKVWQDTNQDGISQANELKTLSQAGVNTIELNVFATNINLNGNLLSEAGRYSDSTGTRSLAADVELTFDSRITTVDTSLIPDYTVHPESLSLPSLRGYGVVYNSEIAYNVNDTLRNLALGMSQDITAVAKNFDAFMAEWTGLNDLLRTTQDKYHLSTPPTLSAIDAKVWIYERFLGQKNFSVTIEQAINSAALRMTTGGNPVAASRIPYRVAEVEQSYNTIQTRYQSYFTLQTFYPDVMANASYDISIDEFVISDTSVFAAGVRGISNLLGNAGANQLSYKTNSTQRKIA